MLSLDILSFDMASFAMPSLFIVSFFMLSFDMLSLDILSFDIVSFFIVSSANAGAPARLSDIIAAEIVKTKRPLGGGPFATRGLKLTLAADAQVANRGGGGRRMNRRIRHSIQGWAARIRAAVQERFPRPPKPGQGA